LFSGQGTQIPGICGVAGCGRGRLSYSSMLEALADSGYEEHEDYVEWAGENFDLEAFDLGAANATLQRVR